MGAALDWVAKEYGFMPQEQEATFATTAVPALALKNDPDALALTFVNFGATDIELALAQNAPAGSGVKLLANGGIVSLNVRDDLTLPTREWYATSPAGAGSLYSLRIRGEVAAG